MDLGILVHQPFHAIEIFQGRILGTGRQHLDPQFVQGINHRPGLDSAGE